MKIKKYIYFIILLILLNSCTTFRANIFMMNKSDEIKSAMMFEEGVKLFNLHFVENKDLNKLNKVRQYFEDVLILDSSNIEAMDYIKDIDDYIHKQFFFNINQALLLRDKIDRSEEDNVDYVIYVLEATKFNQKHPELKYLQKEIKAIKPIAIEKLTNESLTIKEQILNEQNHKLLLKYLNQIKTNLRKLDIIDNRNNILLTVRSEISNYLNQRVTDEIVITNDKMSKTDYIGAELTIRQADQIFTTYYGSSDDQITDTKYNLFYNWSKYLTDQKKYTTALNILYLANDINPSQEVKDLIVTIKNKTKIKNQPIVKSKISEVPKPYNYDQDIDDILSTINFSISKMEFTKAKNDIDNYLLKLKQKDNLNKLKSKLDEITTTLKSLYEESITLYNDEDYEGAFENLKIIVNYNSNFEQAQAYFDKTNAKLRALNGEYY